MKKKCINTGINGPLMQFIYLIQSNLQKKKRKHQIQLRFLQLMPFSVMFNFKFLPFNTLNKWNILKLFVYFIRYPFLFQKYLINLMYSSTHSTHIENGVDKLLSVFQVISGIERGVTMLFILSYFFYFIFLVVVLLVSCKTNVDGNEIHSFIQI